MRNDSPDQQHDVAVCKLSAAPRARVDAIWIALKEGPKV